jgi:hypothetical protein
LEKSKEKRGLAGGEISLCASYRRKVISMFHRCDLSALKHEPKKFLLKNFWARVRDK